MSETKKTADGYSTSLDIFSPPVRDIGLLKREWVDYAPANTISEGAPIEFAIDSNPQKYIDLSKTLLNIKGKVVNGDGTALVADAPVAPVNNTLHSLWRQVDLSLNQVPLPSVGTNYGYKSILDLLLGYGEDAKKTQLQAQMYVKDMAGFMDDTDANFGYNWRKIQVAESRIMEATGPLSLDLAQQERCLINSVAVAIKLWPSSDRFRLTAKDKSPDEKADYKFVVTDATLMLCEVSVNPEIMLGHDKALDRNNALYPYVRSEIKTYTVAKEFRDFRIDNLWNGRIPSTVIMGIVAGEAYSGSYYRNPYNFHHYDLNSAAFYVNNIPVPEKPFTPQYGDKSEGVYSTPYLALFGDKVGENFGNYIQLTDYPRGYALYRFEVGEDETAVKAGNTRMEISFAKPLPEVVTVVVYARFPSLLRVDKSRNILL